MSVGKQANLKRVFSDIAIKMMDTDSMTHNSQIRTKLHRPLVGFFVISQHVLRIRTTHNEYFILEVLD